MDLRNVLKNAFYASGVQVATMLFGLIKTFMIPKMLGVIGFGWWQYYLLWVGYVGFFALGYNDGFYLKYGSYDYNSLPKARLNSGFRVFLIAETLIGFLFVTIVIFSPVVDKMLILFAVAFNIPLLGIRGFFIYVFQVTNRIKRYSFYSLIDRFSFLLIVSVFFLFGVTNYWLVIILDIMSQVLVTGLMLYNCRDILIDHHFSLPEGLEEFKDNIYVGIKLMIAIFTAGFAGGLARLFVEHYEGIEVFSCFSFATASTNVIILFINGLATIAYPTLARLNKKKYGDYFVHFDRLVSAFSFCSLLAYPFFVKAINFWFSDYSRCLAYFPIIMGGIFVSTKMSLVVNSFYKAMRKEKTMLIVNVLRCVFLVFLLFAFYYLNSNEFSVAMALFVSGLIIYYYSKIYLSRELACLNSTDCIIEIIMLLLFISSTYMSLAWGTSLYIIAVTFLMFYYRKDIAIIVSRLKSNE